MSSFFLKLIFGKNHPFLSTLNELEAYNRRSSAEITEILKNLSKPRKKSDFVIQAERKLGLNLPEYY